MLQTRDMIKTLALYLLLAISHSLVAQSTLFLDSVSRKPIPAVRVYCAQEVFYSNAQGEIPADPQSLLLKPRLSTK